MSKPLPRYQVSLDPSLSEDGTKLGMTRIAYVKQPAILTKGLAFSEHLKQMRFADALKGRVAAPMLIPDLPIYRQDAEMGEYEVVFSKEVIEELYTDFMLNKDKFESVFDLDHIENQVAPSYILESWVTGPSKTDKSFTKYGIEVPEGSIFVVSQFTDMDYFKREIIEGDRAAYSIEAFLALALSAIKKTQQNLNMKYKFDVVKKADGGDIFIDGAVAVDSYVYHNIPNIVLINDVKTEMRNPIWETIIELADGSILELTDGKIVSIKQKEITQTQKETQMNKDLKIKTLLAELAGLGYKHSEVKLADATLKDGTKITISALEVGGDVTTLDENGNEIPLFDGDHILDDGSTISTVAGKITEIKPATDAVAAEAVLADTPVVAPAPSVDEAAILAIIQPKLDEIYKAIADLKTQVEADAIDDAVQEEVVLKETVSLSTLFNAMK